MKRMLFALLIPFALLCAEEKKPAAKAKPSPTTVPADAERVDIATWRHTDKDGKVWIYRKTPFGLVVYDENEQKKQKAAQPLKSPELIVAFDDGDNVRFEKPSAFGTLKWSKKKTNLNEAEQAAWKRAQKQKTETAKAASKPANEEKK